MSINIKKCQGGRSMIEMLGVLAIIGVLSVGGIAGYSKAMERYRVNETINQISHIVQNTRDLFKTQPNLYGGLSDQWCAMSDVNYANRKLADKAKLFPTSIVKNSYKNLFGGDIRYYASGRFSENDSKAFISISKYSTRSPYRIGHSRLAKRFGFGGNENFWTR